MEYIEGGSLRGVVRSQGSGLREGVALSYIRPICEAVQYIHEEYGLLHCDIKPDNIMLRLDDDAQPREPVLIDFGISIHFNKKGEATTTRSSIGGVSPGYSPQEQYLGLDVIMETREKARREGLADLPPLPYEIDVYALGATLYYLLTGKDPDVASFSLDSLIDKRLQSAGVSDRMRTAVTSAMRQNSMSRTSTVRGFLQGFEERYSLPQGFILRGPHRSYQVVTGLMEEGSGFLRYEAVVYIPPVANSGGVPTKSQHFHLYECFDKSVHQRNRDESVGLKGHPTTTVFEAFHALMQSKTGLTATGEERAEGTIVHCDAFAANGTEYFVARHGYKPPVENFLTKMLASVGGLFGSKKKTTEQVSPSKIDTSAMPTVPSVIGRLMENMVFVEGGTFTMGATSEQGSDAYDEEKPAHQVTLSSYYIGKYEVTQEEWEAVMGNNPSAFKGSKRPVESVSWLDCQEFISKLNAMTGQTFRLPTEAEWEYAARGGNKSRGTKYAGGSDIGSVAWYRVNIYDKGSSSPDFGTHPVGQKQPNELGLYDMSGNVCEWCNDWYDWKYYKSSPQTNPQGPSSGSDRVYRGGSWDSSAGYCRVSYREDDEPSFRYIFLGLRLARQFFP